MPKTIPEILLIGHAGHEEVEGTTGRRPSTSPWCNHPPMSISWTYAIRRDLPGSARPRREADETLETVNRLREKFPLLKDPPSDDIRYDPQNRQLAIKQIAAHRDLVIVAGSANSSNSVRLVEVAPEAGAKRPSDR